MSPLSWSGGPLLLVLLLGLLFHSALAVERHYYIAAVNITWNYNGHRIAWTHIARAGSLYFDNTSLFEKEDDQVFPGQEHTYYWELTAEVSPTEADPPCLTYTYISHYDIVRDYNTGLIGTLLVCKNGSLGETGEQIHFAKEFSLLFGVFDESKSWFRTPDDHPKYTINGYMHGTIPELMVCAHTSVSWHLLGMSSERDLFSVHFNGQVMLHAEHRVSSVGLASGTATSASMTTTHPGRWLVSSYISRHMEAGMHGYLNVESCKGVTAPVRKLTSREKRQSQEWTYYIAAEEDIWDYAPSMPEYIDGEYRAKYLRSGPDRIGKKYRKAFFTQYKDETFKEREEKRQRKMERGILGPVIRAQIRDLVKIVFKNMASRPYSIYPHGLTIKKSEEGASYPEGGNQTNAVLPGQTHTYVWEVWEEDEPTSSDPRCLTRMYHSAVDPARDIASGLIGPLLICKSQSLSKKNVQLKADKEQQAVLSVFDENKSWYIDKNINTFCGDPSKVNKEDPEFYNSNVMHSINGYIYDSGQVLGFCNEEIVTWHMSSIGAQDHIEAATFYGHSFELNDRVEDILSLFPMTGETITMNMNNIGHWLLASLNPGEASKGVRLKFKDLECYRDYFYDYTGKTDADDSASSMELSSESKEDSLSKVMDKNITFSSGSMNLSSSQRYSNTSQDEGHIGDAHMGNISHTASGANASYKHGLHSDSNKDMSESREKVAIYLKNNSKEAILTVSLDHQKEHWGYDGRHQLVPLEIPDHVTKYTKDESRPSVDSSNATRKGQGKKPKRKKWPAQSRGMKTRKRKVYKPNPRSGFSPRGHGPHWFVPRGSRPITSAEDLSTNPIIIGLPRRDFNDYELYIPNTGDDVAYDFPKDSPGEEYEYVDYKDPYSQQGDFENIDEATKYALKLAGDNVRAYFIAAEEVEWDYEGYGQRRQERANIHDKPTQFTKVVFRNYLDSAFTTAEIRGEVEEHLGLLGPIIKAEVDQTIMVVFKNLASRPYSLHAHGVSYSKQMEGLKYDDESPHWYKFDNEVQPQETYTYIWKADSRFGPKSQDSDCRTWAYYSGVNPEKDINSGLIGPLLVCRKGTLDKNAENMREFVLLFMTFDETKSWYYDKNVEKMQRKYRRASKDPSFIQNIQFPAINGIIFSLKGLRMYTDQLVRLHLMNMGSPKDVHSISFHGQTFLDRQTRDRRHGVYQLLPGSFADLEMWPSKPGLWQLETEVGDLQLRGMQTLFLVIDNSCGHPLGLSSQSVKDSLITASDYTDEWKPHLARLHNSGRYNAWSSEKTTGSWIQVDFQRPVVISRVATQGARQYFHHHYVEKYAISYSTDKRKWTFYRKGINRMIFTGNKDAIEVKENTFFPPLIGRFIRLYPIESFNRPTVRMEFYGCELDGCSVPLGMESGRISNHQITASSTASSWFSGPWHPWLARLNKLGAVNAWQAKNNNMQQWLQVELKDVKKITGIVTQGAKSLGSEMYVTEYTLEYSKDGKTWTKYKEDEDDPEDVKVFPGNVDNNGHVKNHIYPPIFSRFIRIIPRSWQKTITMRIELLGCDFE
ncbi:hypothetical protein JZ751_028052 [Albula glossodonta]|uniref:ferroxidase n=1 Tax=Albula glossodonta TaxID=121402 RepID=A0A8T2PAI5_9TELE|nr:hypothetical protein JZ751_028052 [Albula glossodonta]